MRPTVSSKNDRRGGGGGLVLLKGIRKYISQTIARFQFQTRVPFPDQISKVELCGVSPEALCPRDGGSGERRHTSHPRSNWLLLLLWRRPKGALVPNTVLKWWWWRGRAPSSSFVEGSGPKAESAKYGGLPTTTKKKKLDKDGSTIRTTVTNLWDTRPKSDQGTVSTSRGGKDSHSKERAF